MTRQRGRSRKSEEGPSKAAWRAEMPPKSTMGGEEEVDDEQKGRRDKPEPESKY